MLFAIEHIKHDKRFMLTPLEIVCMSKSLNLEIVKHLLNHNARPNIKSPNGIHPLIIACFYEYNDLVEILLKNEANVNVCDGLDTLCLAIMEHNGEEDIINVLSYTDCTKKTTMSTPLHIASMTNSQNMVNLLLQNSAKLTTACNVSPFLLAIQNGNYQMSASVDMNISYYRKLKAIKDMLPLHAACLSGYQDVVETLMENKSFHNTGAAIGITSVQVACIKGYIYPHKPNRMTNRYFLLSALQIASLGHYWNICKMLIYKVANITETFDVSNNLMACFSGAQKDIDASLNDTKLYRISIFEIFIENGQNGLMKCILDTIVKYVDLEVIENLKTLFIFACSKGNLQIVSHLYNKLVTLNRDDIDFVEALNSACQNRHEDVSEFLESNFKCIESKTFDKETLLYTACRFGLTNIVGKLLRGGVDPFMEPIGMNCFCITCLFNHEECLKTLFRFWETKIHSASNDTLHCLDIVSDTGNCVLNIAYQNRNTHMINLILSLGANINCTYGEKDGTLLMEACKNNEFQITKLLLQNSANVNSRNNKGQTALCISCEFENYDIVELLVNYGANVNISTNEGLSPLYFACINQQVNTVRLLLQNQADTNVCFSIHHSLLIICCMDKAYELVDLLLQNGADVNFCHKSDETAFYKAFQMADVKLINSLIVYNAVRREIFENQEYFLFEASKKGLVEIVEFIIQNNQSIDLNALLQRERTPLYACYEALSQNDSYQYKSQIETGSLLLRHGADLFESANIKDTSLHQLCEKGKISDIEKVLQTCILNKKILEVEFISACTNNRHELAYSLKIFLTRPYGTDNLNNILFMAAKTGMDDIVEDLLHSNFDIDIVDITGQTALHIASMHGNHSTVEKLLSYGKADINKQTDEGYTPLYFACCNGHVKVIEILLNKGAAMHIRSNLDETIVAVAFSKLHANVIDILLNWNMEETIEQFLESNASCLKTYVRSFNMQNVLRRLLTLVNPNSYLNFTEFPLHFACRHSDNELIDQLLDHNPNLDVDCISKCGVTPLLVCVSQQDVRNVIKILEFGASVNMNTNISHQGLQQIFGQTTASDMKHITPLSLACFVQNVDIIHILIDRNATVQSPIHICYDNVDDCSECEVVTPLCVSIIQNNLEVVKLLVNSKLDTTFDDVNYIMFGSLFEKNSMTEKQVCTMGRIQLTSFQVACVLEDIRIASFLIEKTQADINSRFTITPIFLSLYYKYQDTLMRIMSRHKIRNTMFQTEISPLVYSAVIGNIDLMELLLDNHANHNSCVSLSLLHVIAMNEEILTLFDSFDKDHYFTSECTIDSLFISCLKDNTDMSNALLKYFASPASTSEITALHAVCLKGLVHHLRQIFENDCNCNRHFFIQSYHLPIMCIFNKPDDLINSDQADTGPSLQNFNPGIYDDFVFNLRVTFTELSCLVQDSTLIEYLLTCRDNNTDIMEFSHLFLCFLFSNGYLISSNKVLSILDFSSCSVSSNTYSDVCNCLP